MNNAYKDPTHEILFDLTWGYALWHEKQKQEGIQDLWDNVGGSRGIFEWLFEQAGLFQKWWDDLPEDAPERDDYYGQVDCWLTMALNEITDKELK